MDELSLNLLDIVQNSIHANATLITINVIDHQQMNCIGFEVIDNGCGMTDEQVSKVIDPFYTTRTTRTVGFGIPFLQQLADETDGELKLSSVLNSGTKLSLKLKKDNIDVPVMGNLADTLFTIIQANQTIDFYFKYLDDVHEFIFDSKEIKEILDGVDINSPEIILWIKDYIKEGLKNEIT